MTQREVERSGVIAEVAAGRMRQSRAGQVLGLSCRQIKRLVRVWRQHGAAGLRSGHRGRPGNRRYPQALREQVLALARERYTDFGPTLLGEYLAHEHQITLSTPVSTSASGAAKHKTARHWMPTSINAPHASPPVKPAAHHPWRRFVEHPPRQWSSP